MRDTVTVKQKSLKGVYPNCIFAMKSVLSCLFGRATDTRLKTKVLTKVLRARAAAAAGHLAKSLCNIARLAQTQRLPATTPSINLESVENPIRYRWIRGEILKPPLAKTAPIGLKNKKVASF